MLKAGQNCTKVNGPRNYPGVPFFNNDTCVYFGEKDGVAKYCDSKHCESSCTANQVSGHRPLCNCRKCLTVQFMFIHISITTHLHYTE